MVARFLRHALKATWQQPDMRNRMHHLSIEELLPGTSSTASFMPMEFMF